MRNAGGQATWINPAGNEIAMDTYTCSHCNSIVLVKPKQDPSELGGFCRLCMKHICKNCACKAECSPFEKKLEEMERRERFRSLI